MININNILVSNLKKKVLKIKFNKINKTKTNFNFLSKCLQLNIIKTVSNSKIKISYIKNKNNIFLFYNKKNGRI
jgi:hypothetical protein